MPRINLSLIVTLFLLLLPTACQTAPAGQNNYDLLRQNDDLYGELLVWHGWNETEAYVLEEIFNQFMTIYPNVTLIHTAVPAERLVGAYTERAVLGFGPDLLLGESIWIPNLVDQQLIQSLHKYEPNTAMYLSTALESSKYQGQLYGLPFTLRTEALYFNRQLVTDPPSDLDLQQLELQVREGHRLAIPTNFYSAFWGVPAFGGQLFNEEGRVVLNQGGFANWLGWLKNLQGQPNALLSNDTASLRTLFKTGEIDYFVGQSNRYQELQEALGNSFGVMPLPSGPNGQAGPLLQTEAMLINAATATEQAHIALALIEFLSSTEQQRKLVTSNVSRIPANTRLQVDRRVYPAAAAFITQAKTAVPLPNLPPTPYILANGNEVYNQVLQGVIGINEAAHKFTTEVNEAFGMADDETTESQECPTTLGGSLQIWHRWEPPVSTALNRIANNFMQRCPQIYIGLSGMDSELLLERYRNAVSQQGGPEILIGPSSWLPMLVTEEEALISSLDYEVEQALMQRFIPLTQEVVRYFAESQNGAGTLYGLPITLNLPALYYNTSMVSDPARQVEELFNQAAPDRRVALPVGFEEMIWGLIAFGSVSFDAQFVPVFNQEQLTAWLSWLQKARQENSNFILSQDTAELEREFLRQDAIYMGGNISHLYRFQLQLGEEVVGVVPYPAGPQDTGRVLVGVEMIMLNANLRPSQEAIALQFADFLTAAESQRILLTEGYLLPANANVDINAADHPALVGFADQAVSGIPRSRPQLGLALREFGNQMYIDLLRNEQSPEAAAREFIRNITPILEDNQTTETMKLCVKTGRLMLWHSLGVEQTLILSEIINRFNAQCPEIVIDLAYIAPQSLFEQLTTAIEDETIADPDMLLTSHELLPPLQQANYLRPIESLLQPLYPQMVEQIAQGTGPGSQAAHYQDLLYGVPVLVDVPVLYHNPALIEGGGPPATTLEQLLATAEEGERVGLPPTFSDTFWGVTALSTRTLTMSTVITSPMVVGAEPLNIVGRLTPTLTLDEAALTAWLQWLREAQTTPGMLIAPPTTLHTEFAAGNLAYFVGSPNMWRSLQATVEETTLSPLPHGSEKANPLQPFMRVKQFLFPATVSITQTELALEFAAFTASAPIQNWLISDPSLPPLDPRIEMKDDAPFSSVYSTTEHALLLPFTPMELQAADEIYTAVLSGTLEPAAAAARLIDTLQEQ